MKLLFLKSYKLDFKKQIGFNYRGFFPIDPFNSTILQQFFQDIQWYLVASIKVISSIHLRYNDQLGFNLQYKVLIFEILVIFLLRILLI